MLRKIKYALFILFILFLVVIFYLTSMGLPRSVVNKIEPYLQFSGMVLSLDKIKLSIFEGIVVTHVKYYRKGDIGEPIIQADRIVLKFKPLAWMRGGNWVAGAVIKNGCARLAFSDKPAGKLVLDNIFANVLFVDQTRLRVISFATTISGLKLSGRGTVIMPRETTLKNGQGQFDSEAGNAILQNIPVWLNSFAVSNTASVDMDFYIDPNNIEKLTLKAGVHGRGMVYDRTTIGAWTANLSVNGKKVQGTFALKDAEIEKIWIQSLNGKLQFDEKGVITASLKSMVGQESQTGPLVLQLNYDTVSSKFEGQATAGCDLRAFVPLLRSYELKLADIFAGFDFKRSLPSANIHFKGELQPVFSCRINGDLFTDTLSFRQVPTLLIKLGFDAALLGSEEKVTIKPLLVVRDEGLARGQFVYNSEGNTISFSGMSMADPKAIAAMIDPLVLAALNPYSFDGLCYITAFGTVGYSSTLSNNAEISFNASDVRWKIFDLAPCALTIHIVENNYNIDDFNASIYRGVINGSASVDPQANSSNMVFAVSASAENIDFGVMVNSLTGKQLESAYEGLCSANISLQGLTEDPNGSSIKGKGWLKIENGRIFMVPIFSGLFDMISKVIPGIGNFNGQNNAQATITVENGKVNSRNIFIEGDLFSLKGSGDIYFDGRLDFKVQVTFMRRQSLIGNLVQIVTLPFTKAFQFHLSGTVSDPKWDMSYLPF